MKMLDYVQLAHVRMGENLERSSELVAQLVDIFQSGSFPNSTGSPAWRKFTKFVPFILFPRIC